MVKDGTSRGGGGQITGSAPTWERGPIGTASGRLWAVPRRYGPASTPGGVWNAKVRMHSGLEGSKRSGERTQSCSLRTEEVVFDSTRGEMGSGRGAALSSVIWETAIVL